MCSALSSELYRRTNQTRPEFQTFYAGGGTPTLLPPAFWAGLVSMAGAASLKEVTIETNPASADAVDYYALLLAGFNRVSVGVQSFSDKFLQLLGRRHSAVEAGNSLRQISNSGFRNISIDLMYGLPGQTPEDHTADVEEALRFAPQHISVYDLTLEPGTPMGDRRDKASENLCTDMYHQTNDLLTANGYIHYEVSSYALEEKYRSFHNFSYWNRTPYMGIGPSAHSFTGTARSWNTGSISQYKSALLQGELPVESSEELTDENAAHEILALGFRNTDGVNLDELAEFGYSLDPAELLQTGLVSRTGNMLVPDAEGMLFADYLALKASELFTGSRRV
jgi:oxygen-independent coproporphyrinogen-3 oxidase